MTSEKYNQFVKQLQAVRRTGTPLVAIETHDQVVTAQTITQSVRDDTPIIVWDTVRGAQNYRNASTIVKKLKQQAAASSNPFPGMDMPSVPGQEPPQDPMDGSPVRVLQMVADLPERCVVILWSAHAWLQERDVQQAISNLRDTFKTNFRTLVLSGPDFTLPPTLSQDVVTLHHPLPDADDHRATIKKIAASHNVLLADEKIDASVDAGLGLTAFSFENAFASALSQDGVDIDDLWRSKREQIENTEGLKVHRGNVNFTQVKGIDHLIKFATVIMRGEDAPRTVLWIDEIEKCFEASEHDTSGVTKALLGIMLTWMTESDSTGILLVGGPGTGKSLIAKSIGNCAGRPTVQCDLHGMKDSLVGSSERNLRNALNVAESISGGNVIVVATCNALHKLPAALRRRFTLGTFYVDLPTDAARRDMWEMYINKYGLDATLDDVTWDDSGWTGDEVRRACDIAHRAGYTLAEAAAMIIPYCKQDPAGLASLRKQANGHWLDADKGGAYVYARPGERDEDEEMFSDTPDRAVEV